MSGHAIPGVAELPALTAEEMEQADFVALLTLKATDPRDVGAAAESLDAAGRGHAYGAVMGGLLALLARQIAEVPPAQREVTLAAAMQVVRAHIHARDQGFPLATAHPSVAPDAAAAWPHGAPKGRA